MEMTKVQTDEIIVTFSIDQELYGVPVNRVREIVGMTKPRSLPDTLPYMKGVFNLRGVVVPLVDMRVKFSLDEKSYDKKTVIVIVEVASKLFGMIVDFVSDVINVPLETVQDTPHFSSKLKTDSISGIIEQDKLLVVLLDIDRLLSAHEIEQIEHSIELEKSKLIKEKKEGGK